MSRQRAWEDEHGFTLVELIVVILIMGIVFAIASSTWFGAIESRKADSATNQVVADLRHANSKATNRLEDYSFVIPSANSTTYEIGPTSEELVPTSLPDGTQIAGGVAGGVDITFHSDGSAEVNSGTTPITVRSSQDPTKCHQIDINTATSRIEVDPVEGDPCDP